MSDSPSGLRELAQDVRERVVVPPYDEVSRRVRARRLRGAAASVAAAVLVVGGVAVWQNLATTAASTIQPGDRTQTPDVSPLPPTDESLWREVVDGTSSHPFETQGTDDGSIAVVWRALEHPEPTFALVIREADGTVHGRRLDEPVSLTPVPGGWVGVEGSRAWFIASDGTWTELGEPGQPRRSEAGDVFIHGQYGSNMLYSPAGQRLSSMPQLYGDIADGYVKPNGDLVSCGRGQDGITVWDASNPGAQTDVPGSSCVVAGRGDAVTVVGLGDDPDGGIPMTGLLLKHGNQVILPRMADMLDGVTSVVVTVDGTTAITDASSGDWYLVAADGHFRPVDRKVGEAFVSGDRLYVSSYGFMNGPLFYSQDDGRTWQETVLPGNEE